MHIYRITITMDDRSKGCTTGLFASSFEAVAQTLADFPQARSVSAICLRRGAAGLAASPMRGVAVRAASGVQGGAA